jgi:LPS sulfotransferase NodH
MKNKPKICYIICSSPRSGSHLYSSLLSATGLAGNPEEHFNPWGAGSRPDQSIDSLLYDRKYMENIILRSATANGVFGTKAQFTAITSFVGLARLESLFPTRLKYLYIDRRDELRQGISLAIARQTEQFFWYEPALREPEYNLDQLRCCLEGIANQKRGWKTYFKERKIEPFRVMYEELIHHRRQIIIATFNYLGVEVPEDFVTPETSLKKQATHINDQWVRLFKESGFQHAGLKGQ